MFFYFTNSWLNMKILHSNIRKGEYKLQIQNLDDLWYLSQIIDTGDTAKGRTIRKIKTGGSSDDAASSVIRKPIFISIEVEKLAYTKDSLRILGRINEASEDISKGEHHSFNVEEQTIISIIKPKWYKYQLEKLKESAEQKDTKILVCVFDREEATVALIKKYGFEILTEFTGNMQKKGDPDKQNKHSSNFYEEIISKLTEYTVRLGIDHVVLASPAFFKEDLMKELRDNELKKKIILATCNAVGKPGINEVLKRPEVKEVLKQERTAKEINLVDKLLSEISKQALAVYGLKETRNAVDAGAVETVLITDGYIFKLREENKYQEIDKLLKHADTMKAAILVISSEHEGGKKLDGLGGIAALLRYRLQY